MKTIGDKKVFQISVNIGNADAKEALKLIDLFKLTNPLEEYEDAVNIYVPVCGGVNTNVVRIS